MEGIRLGNIAGLMTEKSAWKMLCDLAGGQSAIDIKVLTPDNITINENGDFKIASSSFSVRRQEAFYAPEYHEGNTGEAAVVWNIGALAFYAIMGVDLFEGKGGAIQTARTEIPRIGSAHASRHLGDLIYKCLSYEPADRPTLAGIHSEAEEALWQSYIPNKKTMNSSGKNYVSSLVKFWPEEMAMVIILCLVLFMPVDSHAQSDMVIPEEMGRLVNNCLLLRDNANKGKVVESLDDDTKWTMMDEIAIDSAGECTMKDKVTMFGINDIGFRILKLQNGITNSGGRFRNGSDPRYNYSFIEITVKKGATVHYDITGREGVQLFAVVPYRANASYSATLFKGRVKASQVQGKNGVCYLSLKSDVKRTDTFKLSLTNSSNGNMAFVIINYNSRKNEQERH